jgi:hypothetical protein
MTLLKLKTEATSSRMYILKHLLTFEKPFAHFYCCSDFTASVRRYSNKLQEYLINIVKGGVNLLIAVRNRLLIVFFVNATRQAVSDKLLNAYKAGFKQCKDICKASKRLHERI